MKKKRILGILVLLCLALSATWTGLAIYYAVKDHQDYSAKVECRGHSYILLHTDGTSATTHDPDCPCLKNEADKP